MASKLSGLSRVETVPEDALFYVVIDPDGSPLSRGATISDGVRGGASVQSWNFVVTASEADWNDGILPAWQVSRGGSVDILEVNAATSGGSDANLSFQLERRPWGSLPNSGDNLFSSSLSATASGASLTSFSLSRLNPRDHLLFTTGPTAESGSVNYISVTLYYGKLF